MTQQPPSALTDPGLVPLLAEMFQHLPGTLRALPRQPLLESLTQAFRKRFQVPAEAPSPSTIGSA